ncbi:UNVERIFIED_CONTAM: protein SHORT-ROOT [Sesamum latifolium]|uniref:Protein SHORT-ROOT n=1 Tax=Sesamum latifolium TaxID=2727402 RepID=A0AAW2Y896_9LAMI
MDTLFRLVSLQADHSFNSSRTSSSSRSSRQNPNSYHQEDEECFNFYNMDHEEDFSSSSSSKHYNPSYHHHQQQVLSNTPTPTGSASTTHRGCDQSAEQFSFSPVDVEFAAGLSGQKSQWASDVLLETAKAIADGNSARVQQLMWMLNEMSSPYGDVDQKLASYFLQALFSRMTDSGGRTYRTMMSASEQTCSFESTRKMVLKFQEVSPWTMFGHVACNGAIMEAFEGESKLHIIDISNTYCTQWPTLLEAIATRADETPHLRLTTVVAGGAAGGAAAVQKLNLAELEINEDEALAINCVGALHSVTAAGNRRDFLMSTFRSLQPRILTVVEEEADLDVGIDGFEFIRGFQECLRWFRVYFEALDESFTRTSNERLMLERQAGRAIVDLVACPSAESVERRETAVRWSYRLHARGFSPVPFSEEVCDDARSLLRRYKEGWSMAQCSDSAGIFLSWKGQPVVWTSAWRP